MINGKAPKVALKHILCCLILLLVFVLTIGVKGYTNEGTGEEHTNETSDAVPLKPLVTDNYFELETEKEDNQSLEYIVAFLNENYDETTYFDYLNLYAEEIEFFSRAFGFDYESVLADLKTKAENNIEFEPTNIGFLKNKEGKLKTFNSVEYGIVEYFYKLVESKSLKRNKKVVPYTGSSEYIENLIVYYTRNVYTNVDTATALSIGAAESGYYKVKYMLRKNNVFGGMSNSGLITYENIEIGVLKYIRLLSKNYYGKGLDTVAKIGAVYCPVYNNGVKTASSHWINLVNTAKTKYNDYTQNIEISALVQTKVV